MKALTSTGDEHVHVLRCTSQCAAHEEEPDGGKHGGAPTERVRKTARQGQDGGARQSVCGTNPDKLAASMEGLCDRWEGNRDGGEV